MRNVSHFGEGLIHAVEPKSSAGSKGQVACLQEPSGSYNRLCNSGSCRGEITAWEEQHGKPGTTPEKGCVLLAVTSSSPGAHQPETQRQPFLLAFLFQALAEATRGRPGSAAAAAPGEGRGASGASPSSAFSASPLLLAALSTRDQPCCFSASKPKSHPPLAPRPPLPACCSAQADHEQQQTCYSSRCVVHLEWDLGKYTCFYASNIF